MKAFKGFVASIMIGLSQVSQAVVIRDGANELVQPNTIQCVQKAVDIKCEVRETFENTGCVVDCYSYLQVLDNNSQPQVFKVAHREWGSYPVTHGGVFTVLSVLTGMYAFEAAVIRSKTKNYTQEQVSAFVSAFEKCSD